MLAPPIVNVSVPDPLTAPKEIAPAPDIAPDTLILLSLVANVVPVAIVKEAGVNNTVPLPEVVICAVVKLPADVDIAPVKVRVVPFPVENVVLIAVDPVFNTKALLKI